MVKTIGNPLSWGAHALEEAGHMIAHGAERIGSHNLAMPKINRLELRDLRRALRLGVDDFTYYRSDVMMMMLIYPIIGVLLSYMAFQQALIPLLFPLAAGFALIGPVAATGLYELSRRREIGEEVSWVAGFKLMLTPTIAPVTVLGLYLIVVYAVWLYAAAWIYQLTLGAMAPASMAALLTAALTTSQGWVMIGLGLATGFLFAALVLVTAFIAFPMLVDRPVGLPVAVASSLRVARQNPLVTFAWGAIVAVSLALASLPLFLGLIFVLPILGHATWHLYRMAVRFEDDG